MDDGNESWNEFRLLLVERLKELESLKKEVAELKVQIAILSLKLMGISAAIAAAISFIGKMGMEKIIGE
jgi:hypothetical protein